MALGKGLSNLPRTNGSASADGPNVGVALDVSTPEPKRFTPFVPTPRGRMFPVVGTVFDPRSSYAFAQSGGGWVNRDGRTVSRGTFLDFEPLSHPLQAIPETEALLERFVMARTAASEAERRAWDDERERFLSDGQTEEEFTRHSRDTDLAERIGMASPVLNLDAWLKEAGWFPIELRRDNGRKEVYCREPLVEGDALMLQLETFKDVLRCGLTAHVSPAPEVSPKEVDTYATPAVRRPGEWVHIPARPTSGPDNRVVSFPARKATITVAGEQTDAPAHGAEQDDGPSFRP